MTVKTILIDFRLLVDCQKWVKDIEEKLSDKLQLEINKIPKTYYESVLRTELLFRIHNYDGQLEHTKGALDWLSRRGGANVVCYSHYPREVVERALAKTGYVNYFNGLVITNDANNMPYDKETSLLFTRDPNDEGDFSNKIYLPKSEFFNWENVEKIIAGVEKCVTEH